MSCLDDLNHPLLFTALPVSRVFVIVPGLLLCLNLLTCSTDIFLPLLSIPVISYLSFYLNLPLLPLFFSCIFSVFTSPHLLLPLSLSSTSSIILFFFVFHPFVPHFCCHSSHLSSPAASPLCSRSIESLPDNQKYRQLQKELSQVLTQRQIFID